MGDYKKSKDHITNAALATPFILATGNVPAAIAVLGLGKLLDTIEDKEFERKREEWKNNPHRAINHTPDEIRQIRERQNEFEKVVNNLPQIKNAKTIRGLNNSKNFDDGWVSVHGYSAIEHSQTGIRNGEIKFHKKYFDFNGESHNAKLYYYVEDFIKELLKNLNNKNITIYRITPYVAGQGRWMYTTDNGKSYVVGL